MAPLVHPPAARVARDGRRAGFLFAFVVIDATALGVLIALGGVSGRPLVFGLVGVLVVTLAALRLLARRTAAPRRPRQSWTPPPWVRTAVFADVLVVTFALGLVLAFAGSPTVPAVALLALGTLFALGVTVVPRFLPLAGASGRAAAPTERASTSRRLGPFAITAFVLAELAAVGFGVVLGPGVTQESIVLVVALVGGIALGVIAATRFWQMLVILFLVRASLDWFKVGALGESGLDPSTVIGAVFLVAAVLWLLAQRRSGLLLPLSRSSWAFLGFSAACLLSSLGARDLLFSSVQSVKVLSSAMMLVVLEQVFARRPDRVRVLLTVTFLSVVVPVLVGVSQLIAGQERSIYDPVDVGRVQGTFVHPNAFATYLVMIAVLAVALRPVVHGLARRGLDGALLASGAMLLFTYTRSAWGALIVALIVVGLFLDRRLLGLIAAVLVVTALAVPSVGTRLADLGGDTPSGTNTVDANSLSWRISYWEEVLPMTLESPVTGIGLGMVQKTMAIALPPHNVFVQALVETGIVGLTALFALLWALFSDLRLGLRIAKERFDRCLAVAAIAVGVSLLVQAPSENLISQAVSHWYFIVAAAAVTSAAQRAREQARAAAPIRGESAPDDALVV